MRADKNVVVARTFSKIFGMAGVRASMAALQEKATLVPERRKANARVRGQLCQWLDQRQVRYVPSHTNFLMIDVKRDVREFGREMLRQGVAVGRPFPPLENMLRVTIGSDENMQRFREVFSKVYSA